MAYEFENRVQSSIVGDLKLPIGGTGAQVHGVDPEVRVPVLVELNVRYPGGLLAVRAAFFALWERYVDRAGGSWPEDLISVSAVQPLPAKLAPVTAKLYQCVLTRADLREMVQDDKRDARHDHRPATIFRVWPDYTLHQQIDRSASTVKADAAWRSYGAAGSGVVWAVIDSGIDALHPHFSGLEISSEARNVSLPEGRTTKLHRDFSYLVDPDNPAQRIDPASAPPTSPGPGGPGGPAQLQPLHDDSGHGTHVAGIISGCTPPDMTPVVAESKDVVDGGFVRREHTKTLSGMAPKCELVSIKVMRLSGAGTWVTSSSAVIRALDYLRTEVNVDPGVLRVHGINMSLGSDWRPDHYAAGQSPLCQAVNQIVASGVLVVISAGNNGARSTAGDSADTAAVLGSITEPAHAEDCIAVGSTHREAPHVFGVTWTSGKGPTLDGRMKPDVVAPGEWISSAATGEVRAGAGLSDGDPPGVCRTVRHLDGGSARLRCARGIPLGPAGVHRPAAAGQATADGQRDRPRPGAVRPGRRSGRPDADARQRLTERKHCDEAPIERGTGLGPGIR